MIQESMTRHVLIWELIDPVFVIYFFKLSQFFVLILSLQYEFTTTVTDVADVQSRSSYVKYNSVKLQFR